MTAPGEPPPERATWDGRFYPDCDSCGWSITRRRHAWWCAECGQLVHRDDEGGADARGCPCACPVQFPRPALEWL